ncbi:MAG TPA: nitrate reductase [Candidatus Binatia bacterium]|jgi:formate dehydrogenase alpha subunit
MERVKNGNVERWVKSYCPYCGVGCGLLAWLKDGAVARIKGDPDHPSSLGDLCAKAVYLPESLKTPDRLLYPQMRRCQDGPFTRVSWDAALKFLARRFREIIAEHGPNAVAFYGSGQLTTEEYYVGNKLAKGFLGTNNFDTNSRLCMASAVAGYKTSLGSDGPPASYADLDLADCFLLIGTNTADCHPVVFKRIKRRKMQDPDGVVVIAVDPRRTETADFADLHLPIRPGTDIALLNSMLCVLINEELIDLGFVMKHTKGFADTIAMAEKYPPAVAEKICGVPACLIEEAAMIFGKSERALTLWSMGVNQSTVGVSKNNAIHNLHLATGKIGKPGCGPFSLTGQPNAMGGREVGGMSQLLPGYREVSNPIHRAEVARFWGIPAERLSPAAGLSALDLFEAMEQGEVKAVWIMCTNPAASAPDIDFIEKALRKAELVVVQDAYHPSGTTQFAHVLLPAAQWSEKEGVMTNSERRITYMPKLVDAPGEALPDWKILTRFARELGFEAAFPYESAEEIFAEFARLTRGTMCDYSGVTYDRLKKGPLQWPCPAEAHPGTERLYADFSFPDSNGRANFIAVDHQEPFEPPDKDYPHILTTGRVKNQWHTMTRTGKVEALRKMCPEPYLEMNPLDAKNCAIVDADFVEIVSRRGKAVVQVRVTAETRPGTCFMPFHWGRQFGFYKAANNLTVTARDPLSRQPELKACAVRVRKMSNFLEGDM